jgi:hypothetical protein
VGVLKDLEIKTDLNLHLKTLKPWTGGNHTWRPDKDVSVTFSRFRGRRHFVYAFLAFCSVTAAALVAFIMSYYSPTRGVGVRSIVEVTYWVWWVTNATAMYFIGHHRPHWGTTERGWLAIIVKDSIFALFTIFFLLSAWNGKTTIWGPPEGSIKLMQQ